MPFLCGSRGISNVGDLPQLPDRLSLRKVPSTWHDVPFSTLKAASLDAMTSHIRCLMNHAVTRDVPHLSAQSRSGTQSTMQRAN